MEQSGSPKAVFVEEEKEIFEIDGIFGNAQFQVFVDKFEEKLLLLIDYKISDWVR